MRTVGQRAASGALVVVTAVAAVLVASPAYAEDFKNPEDLPEVTNQLAAAAVTVFDVRGSVQTFSPDGHVEVIEEKVRREGQETVITLSTDIFFEPGKADLPATAPENLKEVLEDVPDGANVTVTGHTDSVGDDASNQTLSEQRAQAVADAITQARPDLVLTVAGRGETEPVAEEMVGDTVDASARAKNRRVEIRYNS